jgi:Tfp pilus assembly protein PilF
MQPPAEILTRARQCHQTGDVAEAARLYRQFLQLQPDNPEALALLALACQQQGKTAEAEACYRRALQLRPRVPEIHCDLGILLQSLGRPADAADAFREAIRLRPHFPEAWNNLGGILFKANQNEEAIACFERAVRLRPGYAEACVNLGNALRHDDRLAEGLHWFREALRHRTPYPKADTNLGVALLEMGQVEEAETHLRAALGHHTNPVSVWWILAANGLYRDTDPGPEELRARLSDAKLAPVERSQLHFILAGLLERQEALDGAFFHFQEGNRIRRDLLSREGHAFDPARHESLVDRLIATFTPAFFERVRGFGLEAETPVFVVGMPRSGSSLVEQIISHHPLAAGAGELRDFPRLAEALPAHVGSNQPYPECVGRLNAGTARALGETYLRRLQRVAGSAPRTTDKMLENFLHLGLIAAVLPRSRVIHCRRDALDTCVSCFLQFFHGLDFTWDLVDLGYYYRHYQRLMVHWRQVLPLAMLEIDYESLVAETEREGRRLLAFCGLDWNERCLRFYENPRAVRTVSKLQVRQPVFAGSIGRWRKYAAHLRPLREALRLTGDEEGAPHGG